MAGILKKLFGKPKPEIITAKEYKKLQLETKKINRKAKDKEEKENPAPNPYDPDDKEETEEDAMEEDIGLDVDGLY